MTNKLSPYWPAKALDFGAGLRPLFEEQSSTLETQWSPFGRLAANIETTLSGTSIFKRRFEAGVSQLSFESDADSDIAAPDASSRRFVFKFSSSSENDFNDVLLIRARLEFTSQLLAVLRQNSVEPGVVGPADSILRRSLSRNRSVTLAWLNDLFLENFNKSSLVADLLTLVGRLSYSDAKPNGITMAIAGLSHKDGVVKEAAIRAFEHWASPESLRILESVDLKETWLSEYLEEVKRDLKATCDEAS